MDLLTNIFAFLLLLTILVFVHEFGHFWVARRVGVRVEIFSIGFGPELFGFNDKHGTRWKFSLIPLGGYVKMFGDKTIASNSDQQLVDSMTPNEKSSAFACKSLSQKSAIVAAGPIANYLFAIIIYTGFFINYGYPVNDATIAKVDNAGPAFAAGIIAGDKIIDLDGKQVTNFSDIQLIMAASVGGPIKVNIQRDAQVLQFELTPKKYEEKDVLGKTYNTYRLGVYAGESKREKIAPLTAIKLATMECYNISIVSLKAIGQMIIGKRGIEDLSGPIRIGAYAGKSFQLGLQTYLMMMALISVSLGLMNLLPIPVLDGGHLLAFLVEFIAGKKIANKMQQYGLLIGTILLVLLSIIAVINDLISLFKG